VRIGLVIDVFSPTRGGGEGYCFDLARQLLDRGHEVHVFADRWDDTGAGIEFHRVPARFPGKTVPMMLFALRSARATEGHGLDVVHAVGKALGMNLFNSHGGIEAKWLARNFQSIPSPLYRAWKKICRYLNPRHYFIAWLERKQYTGPGVARYVAISDMLARDIQEAYGLPPDKLRVVYNGVDTERFHPRNRELHRDEVRGEVGAPGDAPVLLHVTNNFRLKGLHTLIRALPAVRADARGKEAELWVLGRGRERAYARLARRLGVAGAVRFLGWRPGAERFYGAADVYAHPTFYDACSLSVLEGMATGLPVVTTSTNGASGYVEEGVNGFVLREAADHEALAGLLLQALNPSFREKAGEAARKRAEEFPLERNTEDLLKVYEEVVAEKGREKGIGDGE
jgi:UDP-glucose:(heptosyl)LPS alpha-1,3-glucosyltransferase